MTLPRTLPFPYVLRRELLEHFQSNNDDEIDQVLLDDHRKNEVSDELAGVVIYRLGVEEIVSGMRS